MGNTQPDQLNFKFESWQTAYLLRPYSTKRLFWDRGTKVTVLKRRARKGKNPRNVCSVVGMQAGTTQIPLPEWLDEKDLCTEEEWTGHLLLT